MMVYIIHNDQIWKSEDYNLMSRWDKQIMASLYDGILLTKEKEDTSIPDMWKTQCLIVKTNK